MAATDDLGTGVINEHEYDDDEYTDAANRASDEGAELVDALWVSGASIKNIADEMTAMLHNSVVPGALDLEVKIERRI